MTTQHCSFLHGKIGRIYVARKGTIQVYLLEDNTSYFTPTTQNTQTITKGPVRDYWVHSIDFAGNFSDYMINQIAYDTEDKSIYPKANPLSELTPEHIEKLKRFIKH